MRSKQNIVEQIIANLLCAIASLCALLPLLLLFIASFTNNDWAVAHGYSFFPQEFSLDAYKYIAVQWGMIGHAYLMTIIVTVIGTAASIIISSLFAYGISQKDIPGMKVFNFLLIFTMLFNGGLVATYYTYVRIFDIKDTILALIIPNLLINAFNVILLKNYFTFSVPAGIKEAANIDGAGEFRVFAQIVMPLSVPIIATVGVMTALSYWNDWLNGLYYLTERDGSNLYTIQIVLNNINQNIQVLQQNASMAASIGASVTQMPSSTIQMAIAVLGILPILILYPFLQKYFVKGITLGGVKE